MYFKSSSFHSDFGPEFAQPDIAKVTVNYQRFPKGPCVSGEMTDLYVTSKHHESFADFTKSMLRLQNHTKAYMDAVDKKDFRAMKSALNAVPEFEEIKAHLHSGKTSEWIVDFYVSRMRIVKPLR
jgi:hypothetical protein